MKSLRLRTRRTFVWGACILVIGSLGCSGPNGGRESRDFSAQDDGPLVDDRSSYLTGITEFHWATSESAQNRNIRFTIRFHNEETICERVVAASGRPDQPGYGALYFGGLLSTDPQASDRSYEDGRLLVARSDAENIQFSTPVDAQGEYRWLSRVEQAFFYQVPEIPLLHEMTLLARGLAPLDSSYSPDFSAAFSLTCDGPFDIVRGYSGSRLRIEDIREGTGRVVRVADSVYAGETSGQFDTDMTKYEGAMYSSPVLDVAMSFRCGESGFSYEGSGTSVLLRHLSLRADHCQYSSERIADPRYLGADEAWFAIFEINNSIDVGHGLLTESAIVE